ncbi:APC family permease [Intestinibacter bartlettii]|uniref:Amino acid permease n=1 Tax=Intestinibacter bartlettii TaxID=261299 RepID=A0ABS6DU59_9FIRM|nr:amino acid permease [Intestinibacter bartlettii]MBU5335351.1 amino acid permease [Intestinibacter bartlettii]MDO5010196.1 amino acid permease [Intestinibacter bartlettii]
MKNQQHVQELSSEKTEFKREIGVFGGVSIIGGIMIGSGIFYLGSYVLQRTNYNIGLALLAWILGGVISLFAGLCYAELGAAMPKAGGRTVYLTEAYHPCVGFLAGFCDWLIGGPGSVAALAIALPTALKPVTGINDAGIKVFAIVLIVGLTVYNCYGVKLASILQNISMVAKLIPILLIMVVALFCGKVTPDISIGQQVATSGTTGTISMVAFAIVASLWAYEGWTNLNSVAEEVKNPKKDLPLAIIIAIGGITILYTLFNYAIYRVLPYETVVSMIEQGDFYLGTEVAKLIFGNVGSILVTTAMVIAMFGSINGLILAQPRTYYAMAVEGHFFKSFAKLHPKYKVPTAPLVVQAIISIILVLMRDLDQLTTLVVFSTMLFNCLTVLAVPILRKKMPEMPRPYKVWFYPVSVIIIVLIYIGLVISTFLDDPTSAIIGFIVPAIGIVFYLYFDKKKRQEGNRI